MKKIIAFIPNLLTLCNLMCGIAAIYYSFNGNFIYAFWAIIIASLFDFSDGFAARLLNARSEIGVQLDSLADMISFGAAPAIILTNSLLTHQIAGENWYLALSGLLLAPFAAYRLAKFNIDTRQTEEFRGLATPAMALFIISFVNFFIPLMPHNNIGIISTIICTLSLCILMVSDIPMFSLKFKSFAIKKNIVRYSFLISTVLILVLCGIYSGIAIVIALYIIVSVITAILKSVKKNEI